MLVTVRKLGETIVIGDNIEVSIQEIQGENVRIGVSAPNNVHVLRKELQDTPFTKSNALAKPIRRAAVQTK